MKLLEQLTLAAFAGCFHEFYKHFKCLVASKKRLKSSYFFGFNGMFGKFMEKSCVLPGFWASKWRSRLDVFVWFPKSSSSCSWKIVDAKNHLERPRFTGCQMGRVCQLTDRHKLIRKTPLDSNPRFLNGLGTQGL